uniref:50S ribosomal protein L6 n=1 Tax=Nephromyces sp. ex Molgula occidentalis TaxID=2544991 RepID=A0A5C1H7N8_9APIC|nr:50S ribosomal protein L6 [Nephromyces sp. ex Molgula occidentalis]
MNIFFYKNSNKIFKIIDRKIKLTSVLFIKNNFYINIYIINFLLLNLGQNKLFLTFLIKKKFKNFINIIINLFYKLIYNTKTFYNKNLYIKGLGYYFFINYIKTKSLYINIGLNHKIILKLPEIIILKILNNGNILLLTSSNEKLLNLICAKIQNIKPPDKYKNKGISFFDNKINKKITYKIKKS